MSRTKTNTSRQTGSGVQNQMYWLPGYLYWGDWQKTRLTEHKRATKNSDIRNHISEHHRLTKHKIDWDSAECVTYSTNYQQRLTLGSWYTNSEQVTSELMSTATCTLQMTQYSCTVHDLKQNCHTSTNNRWIENNSKTTTDYSNFHILTTNHIRTKLTNPNHDQSHISTIIWRQLFTWLWRWLLLRQSKHQSPTTFFLKIIPRSC